MDLVDGLICKVLLLSRSRVGDNPQCMQCEGGFFAVSWCSVVVCVCTCWAVCASLWMPTVQLWAWGYACACMTDGGSWPALWKMRSSDSYIPPCTSWLFWELELQPCDESWFLMQLQATVSIKKSNSCVDDWNVIMWRSCWFRCQTSSSKIPKSFCSRCSVWEWMCPHPSCPVCMTLSGWWLASSFFFVA